MIRNIRKVIASVTLVGFALSASGFMVAKEKRSLIYVSNSSHIFGRVSRVTEYDVDARGDVPPVRTIEGQHTMLIDPGYMAMDVAGDLFVVNGAPNRQYPNIVVFAPGADGDVMPIRTINFTDQPAYTGFPIAVDSQGFLYRADQVQSAIQVFAPGAQGFPTPVRTISGPHTRLQGPFSVSLAPNGHIIATDATPEGRIVEFYASANGDAFPERTIGGSNTQLFLPWHAEFDALGDLYINNNYDTNGNILVFGPRANGNVAPIRNLIPTPYAFTHGVELYSGTVIVPMVGPGNRIDTYRQDANGQSVPIRTIIGPRTKLLTPTSIIVR